MPDQEGMILIWGFALRIFPSFHVTVCQLHFGRFEFTPFGEMSGLFTSGIYIPGVIYSLIWLVKGEFSITLRNDKSIFFFLSFW